MALTSPGTGSSYIPSGSLFTNQHSASGKHINWNCRLTGKEFQANLSAILVKRSGALTFDIIIDIVTDYAASRKVAGSSPDEVDFLN
jgi:hypothetical protein